MLGATTDSLSPESEAGKNMQVKGRLPVRSGRPDEARCRVAAASARPS